jgi:hypothetical protein
VAPASIRPQGEVENPNLVVASAYPHADAAVRVWHHVAEPLLMKDAVPTRLMIYSAPGIPIA